MLYSGQFSVMTMMNPSCHLMRSLARMRVRRQPCTLGRSTTGRLDKSNSVRKDGHHNVPGCHHYDMEDAAGMVWIIDPTTEHNIDVMIDVTPTPSLCMDRQLVLMIRNLMVLGDDEDRESEEYSDEWDEDKHLVGALNHITFHNRMLRKSAGSVAGARANAGDVGTMYALGTRIAKNGIDTLPYTSNEKVPERLFLRTMAICLGHCGKKYFPQVLAVLRDLESDAGMLPVHQWRAAPVTIVVLETPLK